MLEDVRAQRRFSASAADGYHMTQQLFLLFALPVSGRGESRTFDALADHLYEGLRTRGAFAREAAEATASP